MSSLSYREIDADTLAVDFHSSTLLLSQFGIVSVFEIHKSESSGPSSLGIDHHLHPLHGPVLAHDVVQLVLSRVDAEPEHAEAVTRFRVVARAGVTPATVITSAVVPIPIAVTITTTIPASSFSFSTWAS